ncbi:MAG: sensor histidine kinase [Thermodesulfovibrio sp.]|nr:sensor histidine kinase [Thermodesulfovibrio sp.]
MHIDWSKGLNRNRHKGPGSSVEDTYFASSARADQHTLRREIEIASNNPVVDGIMTATGGLLAVLNEHRQILSVNNSLLTRLGIDDAGSVLGLRPGEAVGCVHAHDMPGGCGTSQFCASCGAAIAIVSSIAGNKSVERKCVMTVGLNSGQTEICLSVKASPLVLDGTKLVMLYLQDITHQESWAAFERSFFHDLNNIVTGLLGASELMVLKSGPEKDELAGQMNKMALRLAKEIDIQRALAAAEQADYRCTREKISIGQVMDEIKSLFINHPAAGGKKIIFFSEPVSTSIFSDFHLLLRILTNMLVNALEASGEGDEVRFLVECRNAKITFSVWNRQPIPETIRPRIFQRYFSTKAGNGRGNGTHTMKLFGERILGGEVDFYTAEAYGTVFRLTLPEQVS